LTPAGEISIATYQYRNVKHSPKAGRKHVDCEQYIDPSLSPGLAANLTESKVRIELIFDKLPLLIERR
jgi:hypothetical protein